MDSRASPARGRQKRRRPDVPLRKTIQFTTNLLLGAWDQSKKKQMKRQQHVKRNPRTRSRGPLALCGSSLLRFETQLFVDHVVRMRRRNEDASDDWMNDGLRGLIRSANLYEVRWNIFKKRSPIRRPRRARWPQTEPSRGSRWRP